MAFLLNLLWSCEWFIDSLIHDPLTHHWLVASVSSTHWVWLIGWLIRVTLPRFIELLSLSHCLTDELFPWCIEILSHALLDSLILPLVRCSADLIRWPIAASILIHCLCSRTNRFMIHRSTDSDSLIRCFTTDRPKGTGHRAIGPLGHQATGPPGHRAPATKGLKFVGESDGIWALRRLLYQIRSPSWWSHCWGKSRWFIGSWFWFLNSWMCCVIGASACIHCFICNWHIDPLMWCCTLTCWSFCNHCSMNSKFEWLIFPSFEVIDASMHWAIDSLHRFMEQLLCVSIVDLLPRVLAS